MRIFRKAPFVFTALVTVFSFSMLAVATDDGTKPGYSGAPAVSGRTCTSCHSGTANSGPGSVVIEAPSNYAPGSVIPIRVYLKNMQNATRNGYQAAAYDTGQRLLTGWTAPDGDTRIISDHPNQSKSGLRTSSWFIYFTTPSTATPFAIYASGLDADGNGGRSGDLTYTGSKPLAPGNTPLSMTALPRIGATVPLRLDSPGDANRPYVMASSFGQSGIPIGTRVVPLSLDMLFLLTINNYAPTLFQNYQGQLDGSGQANANLAVPSIAALNGVTLYTAFVVIDATQPDGVGTISNGLMMRFY